MTRLLVLLTLLTGTACTDSSGTHAPGASVKSDVEWHERGRKIYNYRCYFCHGYSGDARTLAATYMDRKPSDFTAFAAGAASTAALNETITQGRAGTAMKGFRDILPTQDIQAVADFVRNEFITAKAPNTHYHSAQNGWLNHERYRDAFAFATGAIALDRPTDELSAHEQRGRALFMRACISCHDRGRVTTQGDTWLAVEHAGAHDEAEEYRPLPSAGVNPATPHDRPPHLAGLSATERHGERIYQANCALCHAADGTGKNWMGKFLEPHPPDLTSGAVMKDMTRTRLVNAIRDGIRDTSMPAWRSVLTARDIDAVAAYINRAFHQPQVDRSVADSGQEETRGNSR